VPGGTTPDGLRFIEAIPVGQESHWVPASGGKRSLVGKSHVKVRWLNWVAILLPEGNLLGGEETEQLHQAARNASSDAFQGIVINLAQVRFMNSVGWGVLLMSSTLCRRVGAKMALCCCSKATSILLGMVDPQIPRFETEEEAVRFCSSR
jgi:anti-anti-sigma factor